MIKGNISIGFFFTASLDWDSVFELLGLNFPWVKLQKEEKPNTFSCTEWPQEKHKYVNSSEHNGRLFTLMHPGRTRQNQHKQKEEKLILGIRKNSSSWVRWRTATDLSSLHFWRFRSDWIKTWATWSDLTTDPAVTKRVDKVLLEVPSSLKYPVNLRFHTILFCL